MNRQKNSSSSLRPKPKKASAKLAPKSKDKYISKADRAKLDAEVEQASTSGGDTPS